jgi:hypothetical protein
MTWLPLPAVLMGSATLSAELPRKCGSPEYAGSPIRYVIDGRLLPVDTDSVLQKLDKDELLSVSVGCINPRDTTFTPTGLPVIAIWTTRGPVSRMEPTLAAIVAAQDAHRREKSEFAGIVSALSLPEYPRHFRITLQVRSDGWSATIRLDGYSPTCLVYDGAPPTAARSSAARQPECFSGGNVPVSSWSGR